MTSHRSSKRILLLLTPLESRERITSEKLRVPAVIHHFFSHLEEQVFSASVYVALRGRCLDVWSHKAAVQCAEDFVRAVPSEVNDGIPRVVAIPSVHDYSVCVQCSQVIRGGRRESGGSGLPCERSVLVLISCDFASYSTVCDCRTNFCTS